MSKIDVWPIVTNHLRTLVDYSSGGASRFDFFLFFGIPLLVSASLLYFKWGFSVDALNALLAAFAIFAGLLLNLLILVFTFSTTTTYANALERVRTQFVRELHNNVAYAVLVSIVIVVVSLVAITRLGDEGTSNVVKHTGPYSTFILV
ncbi:MAG TPA: hypothetical protein VKB26_09620, partial [Candidatus Acidoferrales bacterium]|nr:hypothetical protein [Candidatus Acidoferrales bacterium]